MSQDSQDNAAKANQASKDTSKSTSDMAANAQKGASDASEKMKKAADNAGSAMGLTPMIKEAILADPMLKEDGNLIDVDSDAKMVTVKGHVKMAAYKQKVDEIVKKVLADKHATQTYKNELTIQ